MADLIDRQAAIEAVGINTWAGFRIKNLPSAQPEIIRCKDCRNYINNCCYERKRILTGLFVHDNDFCSWAERRTDE